MMVFPERTMLAVEQVCETVDLVTLDQIIDNVPSSAKESHAQTLRQFQPRGLPQAAVLFLQTPDVFHRCAAELSGGGVITARIATVAATLLT